jgi:hypothetical protein
MLIDSEFRGESQPVLLCVSSLLVTPIAFDGEKVEVVVIIYVDLKVNVVFYPVQVELA